jgi:hypothetical protein
MESYTVLDSLVRRTQKLGIKLEMVGNYPWIYLDRVNGNKVKEKFCGNHGFTIAFVPIRTGQKMEITDISETMKIIRKYRKIQTDKKEE